MANLTGIKMKFTVLKNDDLREYLDDKEVTQLSNLQSKVMLSRLKAGKKRENTYLIINIDEPYADEVIDILKRHGHWG